MPFADINTASELMHAGQSIRSVVLSRQSPLARSAPLRWGG